MSITPHTALGRPKDGIDFLPQTRSCHRCGITIPAWKRKDREPTARSGMCRDCKEADPVYLGLVLGRAVDPDDVPDYDPETREWVLGETVSYEAVRDERWPRAAILAERPAVIAARQRALDIAAAREKERTMTPASVRAEAAERVRRYEQAAMDARR